jgi:hypothetical protein
VIDNGSLKVMMLVVGLFGSNHLTSPRPASASGSAADAGFQGVGQKTCLVRDANRRNRAGDNPQIPSTDRDQAELQARGYRTVRCRMSAVEMRKFGEQVCKVASLHDRVIEARFEELYGVKPEVMCRSAKMHVALTELGSGK